MTTLRIFGETTPDQPPTVHTDVAAITRELAAIDVLFERWEASRQLDAHADQATVIDAYRAPIDRLIQRFKLSSVDVISIAPDHPQKAAMRDKFLHEHTHADFEIRFFVEGQGMFYIRKHERIYAVLCTRGDLLSVPANTRHWFDMGTEPSLKAIRLFTTADGWVASFTGDPIAARFPTLDALQA